MSPAEQTSEEEHREMVRFFARMYPGDVIAPSEPDASAWREPAQQQTRVDPNCRRPR